ncbi:FG-GAP-like repeat-containing protein [Rhodopirellula baltica]
MSNDLKRYRQSINAIFLIALCVQVVGCTSEPSDFEKLRKQQQLKEAARQTTELGLDEQIALAKKELELGSVVRANEIIGPLLISDPDNQDVLRLKAEIQHRLGDHEAAAALLASIPFESEDRATSACLVAADWYVEADAYETAIELLQSRLQTRPDDARVRHRLVEILNQSGHRVGASRVLRPMIRDGKASERELFSMITLGNAFVDESLPAPDFSNTTLALLSLARRQRDQGELTEASESLQKLRQKYPSSTAVAAFQGRVLADLGDFAALTQWRQTLPSGITSEPEYWYALGQLAQSRDEHPVAIRCFGEAIQIDPTDRNSMVSLARSFRQIGENEAADETMRHFEMLERTSELAKVFGLASGTPAQYREMASLLDDLGRPWESIAWQQIAVAKTGNQPSDKAALDEKRSQLDRQASAITSSANSTLPWSKPNLSSWPMPDFRDLESHTTDPSTSSESNKLSSDPAPIHFRDIATELKLRFQYDNGDDQADNEFYLHQQTGGGIGVIDFDRDGWPDLYCAQAGKDALVGRSRISNQLFRNLSSNLVADVTAESRSANNGYGQGITVADTNQDGFPDLLIANIGQNVILLNNGDGTFSRRELPSMGNGQWTTSIACGDLNGDQIPELIEVNYIDDPSAFEIPCVPDNDACGPSRFKPASDRWLSIDPTGNLQPMHPSTKADSLTETSGSDAGHGFAVIIGNLNNQFGNDVYIANDGDANFFWQNRQTNSTNESGLTSADLSQTTSSAWDAKETAYISGIATSQQGGRHGSMGLTLADFDRNGLPDLHVTNYWEQEADLYLQDAGAIFRHSSRSWKIRDSSKSTVGWGTQSADFDRDGRVDLMVLNGHIVNHMQRGVPFRMLPQLYQGHDDHFELVSRSTNPSSSQPDRFWSQPTLGRALAVLDWDQDGMPDVVGNHLDQPMTLLKNESKQQSWLQLELVGTSSEREAIGATIQVQSGANRWTNWVINGGFLTSNEAALDFGLGNSVHPCEIKIQWPSGKEQIIKNVPLNDRYLIIEQESAVPWSREHHSRK